MDQNHLPVLNVKIAFKKSVVNLGKNILKYSELLAQLKNRFPMIQNYHISHKGQPVSDRTFGTLMIEQIHQGQQSIKLDLTEGLPIKFRQTKQTTSKKFSFDPKEF